MSRTPVDGCPNFSCRPQPCAQHKGSCSTITVVRDSTNLLAPEIPASATGGMQAKICQEFEKMLMDARDQFGQHQDLFKSQAGLVQKLLENLQQSNASVASSGHRCEELQAICVKRSFDEDTSKVNFPNTRAVKSTREQINSWADQVVNLPPPPESLRKNNGIEHSTPSCSTDAGTNRSTDGSTLESTQETQAFNAGLNAAIPTNAGIHLSRRPSVTSLASPSPKRLMSSADDEDSGNDCRAKRCLWNLIKNPWFETTFACLIALNAIVLGVEAQYYGIGYGYEIGFPGSRTAKEEVWPWAEAAFSILALCFGLAFSVEVSLKMIALRLEFFLSPWNWFDTFIVGLWVFESMLSSAYLPVNPLILRLVRVVRLLRLVRLAKTVQLFDTLRLLIGSLEASWRVCFWSFMFLFFLMTICALLLHYALEPYILAESGADTDRHELYVYFGTFSRSMLSVFELTLGNWVPLTRLLHEKVTEWFCPILLLYHSVVAFAVITVIRGIFLHETFQVAAGDDELMIMKKERQIKKDIFKFEQLFKEADVSGDGELSKEEFEVLMMDTRVKTWLSAMDVNVTDASLLFWLMDINEDESISAEEFVRGFARLRGPSRSLDMVTLLNHFKLLRGKL